MRRRWTESLLAIWTGCRLSAQRWILCFFAIFFWPGGAHLHQLHLHRHVDGEEHVDGVRLPQDQGVLQREAWTGVPGVEILNHTRTS